MTLAAERPERPPYLIFILVLSVLALAALAAERAMSLSSEEKRLLGLFDWAVCAVFFFDFLWTLARAPNRWRYMATWGWLDLLSSIPATDAFRLARSARIVRLLRLLRALRAARILARSFSLRRPANSVASAALLGVVVLLIASVAILQVEQGPEANIRTAEDALWWALSTMTTVGYGDRFPTTSEGRLVGAALMIVGVGLFGVLTAFLATRFVQAEEEKDEAALAALAHEVRELRREVAELGGDRGSGTPPKPR